VKPSDFFYAISTGPRGRRRILTPVGLVVFFGLFALVIWGGLRTDRSFSLPALLPGLSGALIGLSLFIVGALVWARCVVLFARAAGTPVPFNPPRSLVLIGPYALVRNPMLLGVLACLFGLGVLLHSIGVVALSVLFLTLNVFSVILIEEPVLERTFGAEYTQYKRRVPRFLPSIVSRRAARAVA